MQPAGNCHNHHSTLSPRPTGIHACESRLSLPRVLKRTAACPAHCPCSPASCRWHRMTRELFEAVEGAERVELIVENADLRGSYSMSASTGRKKERKPSGSSLMGNRLDQIALDRRTVSRSCLAPQSHMRCICRSERHGARQTIGNCEFDHHGVWRSRDSPFRQCDDTSDAKLCIARAGLCSRKTEVDHHNYT